MPPEVGWLPAGPPGPEGVIAERVEGFLDALESDPAVEPHSLMVLRHGRVVVAGWWWPYTADRPHLIYSLSKVFTATALGLAVDEGLVALDGPALSYFPGAGRRAPDSRARAVLVRHLASMCTGHTHDDSATPMGTWPEGRMPGDDGDDPALGYLLSAPERDPGSVFCYDQRASYALAAIVQAVTGEPLSRYLHRRLPGVFGPAELAWLQYPAGRDIGYSGLYATTSVVARLGQLYLGDGAWAGRQLLSRWWVQEATRAQVATGLEGADGAWYGYQFRRSQHGYRGDGAYGQYCLVLPQHDAVVAITAQTRSPGRPDMQTVLTLVWDKLVPAFGADAVVATGADERLAARLGSLALPAVGGDASPGPGPGWDGATFVPAGPGPGQGPQLRAVKLYREPTGWAVVLCEEGSELRARLGQGTWVVQERAPAGGHSVPVAGSGAWPGPGQLSVDVIFLETPHRLSITCDLAARTFVSRWSSPPVHATSLATLGAPVSHQ